MTSPQNKKNPDEVSVLIVEDEKNLFEIYREYLNTLAKFKRVIYAQDGIAGTFMVNNESFDLIIVDLNMPKKGGLDFLHTVKKLENTKNSRYIIISGHITKTSILEGLDLGIKNYLTKPFTKDEFVQKVKAVLGI